MALAVPLAAACGPARDGSETAAAQMASSESTAVAATTAGSTDSGTAPGSTDTGTTITTTTGTTGTTAATTDTGSEDSPTFDLPPSRPGVCAAIEPSPVELAITTPQGSWVATQAWWAWDNCCEVDPMLVLATGELAVMPGPVITPPFLRVAVHGTWQHVGAYEGSWPARLDFVGEGGAAQLEAAVTIDSAVDPQDPGSLATTLQVSFAIDDGAWQIVGTIAAPYCGAIEVPACPCE